MMEWWTCLSADLLFGPLKETDFLLFFHLGLQRFHQHSLRGGLWEFPWGETEEAGKHTVSTC